MSPIALYSTTKYSWRSAVEIEGYCWRGDPPPMSCDRKSHSNNKLAERNWHSIWWCRYDYEMWHCLSFKIMFQYHKIYVNYNIRLLVNPKTRKKLRIVCYLISMHSSKYTGTCSDLQSIMGVTLSMYQYFIPALSDLSLGVNACVQCFLVADQGRCKNMPILQFVEKPF